MAFVTGFKNYSEGAENTKQAFNQTSLFIFSTHLKERSLFPWSTTIEERFIRKARII
jgi:hypothetical protein